MNTKGFQLSLNMFVVILLSLVLLGIGFSLFAQGAESIQEISSQVDAQNEATINRLLDDGSILVMPFRELDAERGETTIYYLGIANELGADYNFVVMVSYAGSTAYPPQNDPHSPLRFSDYLNYLRGSIPLCPSNAGLTCASNWVQLAPGLSSVTIANNERASIPIGIAIPRRDIQSGQYFFNVDVCYYGANENPTCTVEENEITNRYGTRIKIAANV